METLLTPHIHFIPKVLPVPCHEPHSLGHPLLWGVWFTLCSGPLVMLTSRLSCPDCTNSSSHDALAQHGSSLTWEVAF